MGFFSKKKKKKSTKGGNDTKVVPTEKKKGGFLQSMSPTKVMPSAAKMLPDDIGKVIPKDVVDAVPKAEGKKSFWSKEAQGDSSEEKLPAKRNSPSKSPSKPGVFDWKSLLPYSAKSASQKESYGKILGDGIHNFGVPPRAVVKWINREADVSHSKKFGKPALTWLIQALSVAHLTHKNHGSHQGEGGHPLHFTTKLAKQLMGAKTFAANLHVMQLFDPLQRHCKMLLGEMGDELKNDFWSNDYSLLDNEHLMIWKRDGSGKLVEDTDRTMHPACSVEANRQKVNPVPQPSPFHNFTTPRQTYPCQDHPLVGVPGWREPGEFWGYDEECIFIHVLRLVAQAINSSYLAKVEKVIGAKSSFKGRHPKAPGKIKSSVKGNARMVNKMLSAEDHRYVISPRPSLNIDINRNCYDFDTPEQLAGAVGALATEFGGLARVKNGFNACPACRKAASAKTIPPPSECEGWDGCSGKKKMTFWLRNILVSVIYDSGKTFGQLATENAARWDAYIDKTPDDPEVPWSRWRAHAIRAVEFLRSEKIKQKPVRLMCEVQMYLKNYVVVRNNMHLLYKVVRAASSEHLYKQFAGSSRQEVPWHTSLTGALEKKDGTLPFGQADCMRRDADDGLYLSWEAITNPSGEFAAQYSRKVVFAEDRKSIVKGKPFFPKFTEACERGFAAFVAELCKDPKADVNQQDANGVSPLIAAIRKGHDNVASVLLEHQETDVDLRDAKDCTALWYAAQNNSVAAVRSLLAKGADVNLCGKDQEDRYFKKAASGLGQMLGGAAGKIAGGAAALGKKIGISNMTRRASNAVKDLNILPESSSCSPLSIACEKGHYTVVLTLLEVQGIDVNRPTPDDKESPLLFACQNGYADIAQLLVGRKDIIADSKDRYGATPFYWACEGGHIEVVELLLQVGKSKGIDCMAAVGNYTPLSVACANSHLDVVKLLLSGDDRKRTASKKPPVPSIEVKDPDLGEALLTAARYGQINIVKCLLQHARNNAGKVSLSDVVKFVRKDGRTILHEVCDDTSIDEHADSSEEQKEDMKRGQIDTMRYLVETTAIPDLNAIVNKQTSNKKLTGAETCVFLACERGRHEIIDTLLSCKALEVDINLQDATKNTPLSIICGEGHRRRLTLAMNRLDVEYEDKRNAEEEKIMDNLNDEPSREAEKEKLAQRLEIEKQARREEVERLAKTHTWKLVQKMLERPRVDVNSGNPWAGANENGLDEVIKALEGREDCKKQKGSLLANARRQSGSVAKGAMKKLGNTFGGGKAKKNATVTS